MSSLIADKKPRATWVVLHNAGAHFELRASSWFMAFMTLGVGVMMTVHPDMLTGSISSAAYFRRMTILLDQSIWRTLFLFVGTSLIVALTINGSFPAFRWTPHIRFAMSCLSVAIWSQVAISVMGGFPTIGTVAYPVLVLVEAHNAFQALKDIRGRGDRNGRDRA